MTLPDENLRASVALTTLLFILYFAIFILTRQLHETGGGGGGEEDDDEDEGLDANHAASGAADAEPSNYIVVANSEFKFKLWQYDASQIQVTYIEWRHNSFFSRPVSSRAVVFFFLHYFRCPRFVFFSFACLIAKFSLFLLL